MKITYLDHSGFAVEYKKYVLIFDWYKGKLPEFDSAERRFMYFPAIHIMIILTGKYLSWSEHISRTYGMYCRQILQEKTGRASERMVCYCRHKKYRILVI